MKLIMIWFVRAKFCNRNRQHYFGKRNADMSDSQFQYTSISTQNQFQDKYDGRKTLSVDIKLIFVVLSRILAFFV